MPKSTKNKRATDKPRKAAAKKAPKSTKTVKTRITTVQNKSNNKLVKIGSSDVKVNIRLPGDAASAAKPSVPSVTQYVPQYVPQQIAAAPNFDNSRLVQEISALRGLVTNQQKAAPAERVVMGVPVPDAAPEVAMPAPRPMPNPWNLLPAAPVRQDFQPSSLADLARDYPEQDEDYEPEVLQPPQAPAYQRSPLIIPPPTVTPRPRPPIDLPFTIPPRPELVSPVKPEPVSPAKPPLVQKIEDDEQEGRRGPLDAEIDQERGLPPKTPAVIKLERVLNDMQQRRETMGWAELPPVPMAPLDEELEERDAARQVENQRNGKQPAGRKDVVDYAIINRGLFTGHESHDDISRNFRVLEEEGLLDPENVAEVEALASDESRPPEERQSAANYVMKEFIEKMWVAQGLIAAGEERPDIGTLTLEYDELVRKGFARELKTRNYERMLTKYENWQALPDDQKARFVNAEEEEAVPAEASSSAKPDKGVTVPKSDPGLKKASERDVNGKISRLIRFNFLPKYAQSLFLQSKKEAILRWVSLTPEEQERYKRGEMPQPSAF